VLSGRRLGKREGGFYRSGSSLVATRRRGLELLPRGRQGAGRSGGSLLISGPRTGEERPQRV